MRGSIALVLVSIACIACGDFSSDGYDEGDLDKPCGAENCDIREPDCQELVQEVVQCFRGGDELVMPSVDVIGEDEYRQLLEGDDAGGPEDDDGGVALDPNVSLERVMHGFSLIKMAPEEIELEDVTDTILGSIKASYLIEDDRIVVIDRGDALDSTGAVASLAHELVHAQQHNERDFEAILEERPDTLDSRLALDAIVEGEATHFEILVQAALENVSPSSIDWYSIYASWQIDELKSGYEDNYPVLMAPIRFPYAFGGEFIRGVRQAAGQPGVDAVFANLPRSTADVLSRSMLAPEPLARAEALAETSVPQAPAGFQPIALDELGSYLYDQFLHRAELTSAGALEPEVIDLIADRVSIFWQPESERTVLSWRLRFIEGAEPSEAAVADFREALDAPDADAPEPDDDVRARVWAEQSDLMIIVSDHPLDAEWLDEDLAWNPDP
jgi:hypothetical protein